MPVSPTYPGVYIEEIPSGVRTITGVATSITAFLGRALRGEVNNPVTINNFGDFERTFGGLGIDYPMSYAVRDFFLNGGAQAIVVRLAVLAAPAGPEPGEAVPGEAEPGEAEPGEAEPGEAEPGEAEPAATVTNLATRAKIVKDGFVLEATSEGTWGNSLRMRIDHNVPTNDDDLPTWVVNDPNVSKTDLFNVTLRNTATKTTETYRNVTVVESQRRIDRILKSQSNLVRMPGNPPASRPTAHGSIVGKKEDEIWSEATLSTGVTEANKGSNGGPLSASIYQGSENNKTGIYALDKADLFNLLCIPPDTRGGTTDKSVYSDAMAYCQKRRAMLIVDSPANWSANPNTAASRARDGLTQLGLNGVASRNAALYFPRVRKADPLRDGQIDTFVPCGIIAGLIARTDTQRGVWKAPAGIEAALRGTQGLEVNLTDDENGMLNPLGINCLRSFPIIGKVAWGARTLRGADQLADEYKYVPIRRLALYIEESLFRGTKWVVFEPNDEPLWSQIRLNVGAFMHNLFRQGAFQGSSPREAYFVKCDKETTTQNDINLGIVNIVVGFAPLKPAEFVIIKIQQIPGNIEV